MEFALTYLYGIRAQSTPNDVGAQPWWYLPATDRTRFAVLTCSGDHAVDIGAGVLVDAVALRTVVSGALSDC
jgi:hypothetical protein